MKLTKFGHCCLLVEEDGCRILTDPGGWLDSYLKVRDLDLILITHEHEDHLHVESLKQLLVENPQAIVVTNNGVGSILRGCGIEFRLLTNTLQTSVKDIPIRAFGAKHADVYESIPPVDNTGYLINEKLFYPGDAYTVPEVKVDVLALPVAGPWVKLSESIKYGLLVAPRLAFPVHDFLIREGTTKTHHSLPKTELSKQGIDFLIPELGAEYSV